MTPDLAVSSAPRAPLPVSQVPRGGEELPPSFAQRRLWFLEQIDAGHGTYNVPLALWLRGALDVALLERAFGEILRRHEALRTSFIARDGQPMQRIHPPPVAWEIPIMELSSLDEEARAKQARQRLTEEAARPFDLAQSPLLKTVLVRLGPEEHVLLINMHQIVSDGGSMGVLLRELSALYQAFHAGAPSPLPELPLQYAGFAEWQIERLNGAEVEAQIASWKARLSGAPPLDLPTDRTRPAVQFHRGGYYTFTLPATLVAALSQVGRGQGATLSMTLLAAFKVLLSRYSGQRDIVVGVPIENRTRAELSLLIGCFANTLVLRTDLSDEPAFDALLGRVKEATVTAYASRDLPFERIIEALDVKRDLSRAPLFQATFELLDAKDEAPELPGLQVELQPVHTGTAKLDLSLSLKEREGQLEGRVEYNADLFDASTIERMMGNFRTLLDDIATHPQRQILDLALLTAEERRRLLEEWNTTPSITADACCVHELFEAQVKQTPDATALVVGHERLTYRELNARANQLGHYLRSRGVGPEVRVGLCMKRTAEIVVAILGVLKAGGAYVPLDPTYPPERLAYTFADARARVLVTQRSLRGLLAAEAAEVVSIDEDVEVLAQQPKEDLPAAAEPGNLAYTMYTSGSTGRPKGIAVQHRSAVVFVRWAVDTFRREDFAGTLAAASIGFDPSVLELFAPLSCGGAVLLAENGLALTTLPAREEVTMITTVPCVMTELVREARLPASVRVVNLAGEPLARSLVRAIYENPGVREVFNLYGPTECTTYSTYTLVPRASDAEPTIGRPVRGTRVYILDTKMQPVPIGVPGEVYVGGAGPARGYLGKPALAAERFVPDPFSTSEGARLYRTGDRARFLPDGDIVFLGRIDFQVKVRGFRIELGEIEAVIHECGSVQQTLVLAIEDVPGDRRLVAYVVPEAGKTLDVAELKRALESRLPGHMVPSAFVVLDAMPLTPNGKVDRKVLPVPAAAQRDEDAFVAPRTPMENQLAELFAQALRVDKVGVHDDFFLLDGNSIKVTRLVNACRTKLGVTLPPVAVFEARTVAKLAARLTDTQASAPSVGAAPAEEPSLVALQPSGSRQPLFLMHPVSGMPFAYSSLQAVFDRDRPLYASMVVLEKEHHARSFEERATIYVRELKRIQPRGPYLLGGYSYGSRLAFEVARQLTLGGDEVSHLVLFDGAAPVPDTALRFVIAGALATRAVLGWAWPAFRLMVKLEAQMTCAPPFREELVDILTSPWFPDRLSLREAESLSLAQLAYRLVNTLRQDVIKAYWKDAVRFTPSWMHDGLGMWRCIKVRKLNGDLLQSYSQRWRHPGKITYFANAKDNRAAQWQPYAERPIDVRPVALQSVNGLDPHEAMFEPENVKLFIDELRQVLG